MSTPVVINGTTYNIPAYNEVGWAQGSGNLSSFLVAVGTIAAATKNATYVSSLVNYSSAVSSPGSNQLFDITSISLTPGLWSIGCNIGFLPTAGTTISACQGGVLTVPGNSSTGKVVGDNWMQQALPAYPVESDSSIAITNIIASVSVTKIYYLKAVFGFSGTAPQAYGRITAIQFG